MPLILVLVLFQDAAPSAPLDRDELVKTFRAHLERHARPLDRFVRRQRKTDHRDDRMSSETTVQIHGQYYRRTSRELKNGIERTDVLTPSEYFHLVRVRDEPWQVSAHTPLDSVNRIFLQERLTSYSLVTDYRELGLYNMERPFEGPGWTVTAVTTVKHGETPCYRFQFSHEKVTSNVRTQFQGYFDVDPTSWVIVRSRFSDPWQGNVVTESELSYSGTVHGVPALKQLRQFRREVARDGSSITTPFRTLDILEFAEFQDLTAAEFTLGHFGLGPPWRAYAGLAAAGLLVIGWLYAVARWRERRRRRTLSWAVTPEPLTPG